MLQHPGSSGHLDSNSCVVWGCLSFVEVIPWHYTECVKSHMLHKDLFMLVLVYCKSGYPSKLLLSTLRRWDCERYECKHFLHFEITMPLIDLNSDLPLPLMLWFLPFCRGIKPNKISDKFYLSDLSWFGTFTKKKHYKWTHWVLKWLTYNDGPNLPVCMLDTFKYIGCIGYFPMH